MFKKNSIFNLSLPFYLVFALLFSVNFFFSPEALAKGLVSEIRVEGMRKIEKDAILARIKSQKGEAFSAESVRSDVESIFQSGYFYDIMVDKSDAGEDFILTYRVLEKPSMVEILFKGNSEFESEELLETSGLKSYEILDITKVKEAQEKLQKHYEDKGYFLAQIRFDIEEIKKDESVRLIFNIEENDKVKVKKITFLGNAHLPDSKLKSQMMTQEGGFFSALSGSGAYKQEIFERDTQLLKYLYFNEGYVEVKIDKPQVSITPDKKGIYITFSIEEGEQYHVGEVDFAGDLLFDKSELFETTHIQKSDIFVYETLQKDLKALEAKYGDLGYAFTNVIPRTTRDEKERKISITFEIDKGNKVYFGKFSVTGNYRTRDKVVRRELKIFEGELYNETRKRESLENIQRLGFFETVNFNTSTPADHPDLLNIEIVVKERHTGTIQVGAGYSSSTNLTFQGQVNQTNFLGKGQNLGASVNAAQNQYYYNFNFTEPYLFDTNWSLGLDAYQRSNLWSEYSEQVTGGALRFGYPLADYLRAYIRYRYDFTYIGLTSMGDPDLYPVNTARGVTSSMTFTLAYDKRNDRFAPSKGVFASSSYEYAGLGGDMKYTLGQTRFQYFKKVIGELVWRNNISYGYINSLEGKEVPFNQLFLLGGPYSLRGYRVRKVGKRVHSQTVYDQLIQNYSTLTGGLTSDRIYQAQKLSKLPFGGTQEVYYTTEFEYPLIQEANIRGVVFFDTGMADDAILLDAFKNDIGFGLRWITPFGPLRFEWGFPLNRDPIYDDPVNFEFAIGAPF